MAQETAMTKQADLKRRIRARMAKTGESYTAARAQVLAAKPSTTLHVTNGDSTEHTLAQTGLASRILVWRDVLHEGPVPDVPDDELRDVRARFLAGAGAGDIVRRGFEERDAELASARDGDYVLWFEADLYDQLQLAEILDRLRRLGVAPEQITLISIGEHLGIAHFGGLGELDAQQLAELPERAAVPLTSDALELAAKAWAALRAPDPRGLAAIVAARSPVLRFVPEAFDRLSREYPSTRDGLSLTERRLLVAVADGAANAGEAFVRAAAREARPFLGDTWAFDRLERLASADVPLVRAAAPVTHRSPVAITETGRSVLAGEADHVTLNGIDRWVGGVHLVGREVPRFDEGLEAVVAAR
jgi:Domain of unknown function (DUF1835)